MIYIYIDINQMFGICSHISLQIFRVTKEVILGEMSSRMVQEWPVWDVNKSANLATMGSFNTPRKNGRHSPDDIFKCIFLNENVRILLAIY